MANPDPEARDAKATSPTCITGMVAEIHFENRLNGYVVARLEAESGQAHERIVGVMPGLSVGDTVCVRGRRTEHARYGPQLQVDSIEFRDPVSARGIQRYLASGAIEGIGEEFARRIVGEFGADTLRVLDEAPERLKEIQGLGKKRRKRILTAWEASRATRRALVFLQGHGLGAALSSRVMERYGAATVATVKENPYRLIEDIRGVGFRTADKLARELGLPIDHPARIEAGVCFAMQESAQDGHVFLPRARLIEVGGELLEQQPAAVEAAIARLVERKLLVVEDDRTYEPRLHAAEVRATAHLMRLVAAPRSGSAIDGPQALAAIEQEVGLALGEEQRAAVLGALEHKVSVITGGPGVGKTTILITLQRIWAAHGRRVGLCAPTGRAARRISEATGRPAHTIHRILDFEPETGTFRNHAEHPLKVDALIVDETSMIDMALFDALLDALPAHASLVMVGDADQLPSVGPGQVLRDVIDSGVLPVARLTRVYRQGEGSGIVAAAHDVLAGRVPGGRRAGPADAPGDFHFVEIDEPEKAGEMILRLCTERIPVRFGFDPVRDVQVLSPIYRGEAGVDRLNARLQAALNPLPAGAPVRPPDAPPVLRLKDKVMQLRNDYQKEVYNGDIGRVASLDAQAGTVEVHFEGHEVEYGVADEGDLTLAYACSIHKSQGSEYPAVVIALLKQHYIMLNRNLLYTAITRGKKLVVVVGSRGALRRAVETAQASTRFTHLAERLRSSARAAPTEAKSGTAAESRLPGMGPE